MLSDDGALTTTMVGILAEREIEPTPLEATVFALGIHEDTGSLTYPSVTQRDIDALGWCMRHGARQEMVSQYLHSPLGASERALLDALLERVEAHDAGGFEVLVSAVSWPEYVDGVSNLVHKVVDLTDARGLVALVEMGAGCSPSSAPASPSSTRPRSPAPSAGAAMPRPPRRSSAARSRRPVSAASPRSRTPFAGRSRRARSCRARRASSLPTTPSRTRWSSASAIARAESSSATSSTSRAPSRARISTRRWATTSPTRR